MHQGRLSLGRGKLVFVTYQPLCRNLGNSKRTSLTMGGFACVRDPNGIIGVYHESRSLRCVISARLGSRLAFHSHAFIPKLPPSAFKRLRKRHHARQGEAKRCQKRPSLARQQHMINCQWRPNNNTLLLLLLPVPITTTTTTALLQLQQQQQLLLLPLLLLVLLLL